MTELCNRRYGTELLRRKYRLAQLKKNELSICFIDINGLKLVNDTLGHECGDELIKTVATVIKQTIDDHGIAIRMGGDEFLVVFNQLSVLEAEQIYQQIEAKLSLINQNENRKYIISISHGIDSIIAANSHSMDELIKSADMKMYEEKKRNKENLIIIKNN